MMITVSEIGQQLFDYIDNCSLGDLVDLYNYVLRPADEPIDIDNVENR